MLIRVNLVQNNEGVFSDFFLESDNIEEIKKTVEDIKTFLDKKQVSNAYAEVA